MITKICTKCGIEKEVSEFYKDFGAKSGLYSHCKECHKLIINNYRKLNKEKIKEQDKKYRETHLDYQANYYQQNKTDYNKKQMKQRYGITKDDYDKMLHEQNGVCAICKQPETVTDKRSNNMIKRLSIDHDHKTGKVRGLLCGKCNKAIGLLNDSHILTQVATDYLFKNG
jgi:hypothetical protein